jgi:hypothetical protein
MCLGKQNLLDLPGNSVRKGLQQMLYDLQPQLDGQESDYITYGKDDNQKRERGK